MTKKSDASSASRLSTGLPWLDEILGGGLIPGTLTVLLGATGIGKTQLAVSFAAAGAQQEGQRGLLFDMTLRGDNQAHAEYAARIGQWAVEEAPPRRLTPPTMFDRVVSLGDYLRVFEDDHRPHWRDHDFDGWHSWQERLSAQLDIVIQHFYGWFVRGRRRVVIDGIEPAADPRQSIQYELLSYIWHQVVRKDAAWLARDALRQHYRAYSRLAEQNDYDSGQLAGMAACTSTQTMLDELIEQPLREGDLLATANTVILMGKIRQAGRLGRGLLVAKHRGSYCREEIIPFRIDDSGLSRAD